MAAQIEQLKSTISSLREDNDRILSLLDAKQKQNAWIVVKRTKQSNINQSKSITYPFPVENRFENLPVEDCDGDEALPTVSPKPTETINTEAQLKAYRSKHKKKFAESRNGISKEDEEQTHYKNRKESFSRALIIGDSMVKHINPKRSQGQPEGNLLAIFSVVPSHSHDRHTTRNHNRSSTGEQREVPLIQLDSDNESITSGGSAVPSPAIPQNFNFPTSSLPKDNELTVLSVKQLNTRLKGLPRNVVNDIKKRRRTLKNRGYAHSCRLKDIEMGY
ncbi:transcription factor Maf-like [Xenia sp. Carnegie-2017]|uniref:transcription factor Maf-like n=1 Tax=Xenia sp. Carnegie-2017 TaxID=2897299 RepID=UPI001F03ECA9|nr:transcription factor Maf-like [Xenia sp. Carnegie-2017]